MVQLKALLRNRRMANKIKNFFQRIHKVVLQRHQKNLFTKDIQLVVCMSVYYSTRM